MLDVRFLMLDELVPIQPFMHVFSLKLHLDAHGIVVAGRTRDVG